ncbi:MAG: galactokinase [Lachnospiraceae bacterium]|nr:galactokinase [Lachnospiraceae bacterium]
MENAGDVKNRVLEVFAGKYGSSEGARVFFAPGRVNLIGEHTDYNGGHVFPCALTIGTYAAVRIRDDKTANFYSMNFEDEGVISLDLDKELKPSDDLKWINYPAGIIWAFAEKGMTVPSGFDVVLYGNIPNGSGLSSSASVEVLTGFILKSLFGFEVSNIDLAKIGQFSENKFNGVNCGIMDQFAIAMGKKDCAIFLDTATLQYEYAPIKLTGCKLVIACSNKKRGLGDSKYNERRAECEKALSEIRTLVDVQSLGELDEATFGKVEMLIKDDVRAKRARHAVYENRRTITAVQALKRENIALFGQLMNASHESLRDDYEVTGPELDTLVDAARKQPGVIGSRMTGAGFGGCTVSIVKDECVDSFIEKVGAEYLEKIGYAADFYVVEIGDGPREIL